MKMENNTLNNKNENISNCFVIFLFFMTNEIDEIIRHLKIDDESHL